MKQYERIAEEISTLIRRGTLAVGQRAPSVRQIRRGRAVSVATVMRAYELLVDRGFIETVPRSGYYVSGLWRSHEEPSLPSRPRSSPTLVSRNDLIFQLMDVARDPRVVPFGSPFMSTVLFPLDRLARCLRTTALEASRRTWIEDLPPGSLRLRRYIATRYAHSGAAVSPDEIVLTTGGLEALYLSLRASTNCGDVVAIECPAFYGCMQALELLGLRAVEVPTHPRLGVSLSALADILKKHQVRACWLMPTFHNPTGALMPEDAKRELVRLLERSNVPLIADDPYDELYFGAHKPRSVKCYDRKGLVLHCGSFSKSLAPGYRIGWVAAGRFAEKLIQDKTASTLATCVPVQEAIAYYLEHFSYERQLRTLRRRLHDQQLSMLRAVAKYLPTGCRVTRPQGGYSLWVELPEAVDSVELHYLALEHGFSVAPGPIFSVRGEFRNCIRLNWAHPWTTASESAMQRLGELVGALSEGAAGTPRQKVVGA